MLHSLRGLAMTVIDCRGNFQMDPNGHELPLPGDPERVALRKSQEFKK